MSDTSNVLRRRGLLASVGPAIITASVVLGPGSILSASRIGYEHGYQMVWVLVAAAVLMMAMTALSARLGVTLDGTLCEELARRAGRAVAASTGIALFLIASCFQFGNNLGVLAAIEPFYDQSSLLPILIIVNLNILVIVALFGFRALYQPVEHLMKILIGLMIIAFAANLVLARPDLWQMLSGLVPQFPQGAVTQNDQVVREAGIVDNLLPITALFATTFSVGGAFYQSYLVRQKGWTAQHLRQGLIDSAVGISTLGLITLMIMITAAAVLHGNPNVTELVTAADVARQLEPAFGPAAKALFCLGIFAGAFSSFLVNAMIGGSVLADGLGLGGYLDQRWPKLCTVLALAIGMNVAIAMESTAWRPVNLIIFAQAMTVLGLPVLAGAMLWLATRADMTGQRWVPRWMKLFGAVALLVTLLLAMHTAARLVLQAMHG